MGCLLHSPTRDRARWATLARLAISLDEFSRGFLFLKSSIKGGKLIEILTWNCSFLFLQVASPFLQALFFPQVEKWGSQIFHSNFFQKSFPRVRSLLTKYCIHIYIVLFVLISEFTDLASWQLREMSWRVILLWALPRYLISLSHLAENWNSGQWLEPQCT